MSTDDRGLGMSPRHQSEETHGALSDSLFSSLFPRLRCHILDLYRTPSGGRDADTLSIRLAPDMSGEIRVRARVVASRGRRFAGYRSCGEIWVFGTSAIRRMRGAKSDPD